MKFMKGRTAREREGARVGISLCHLPMRYEFGNFSRHESKDENPEELVFKSATVDYFREIEVCQVLGTAIFACLVFHTI